LGHATDLQDIQLDLEVFVRTGCPHCLAAKLFLKDLQRERPDLRLVIYDVGEDATALARLSTLAAQYGARVVGVPAFHLRGELIIGYAGADTTGTSIKAWLDRPISTPGKLMPDTDVITIPFFGRVSARELGLPAFTLAIGLLDGFNPCAMWVLLFLLSLLVNLHDRWKMAIIAGTFVAMSGLMYFAFMAAWLNIFLFIGFSRATQVTLGGIAGLIGAVNVKDFFAYKRGASLSIPNSAKPGLYAQTRRVLQAEHLPGALASVILLAALVNLVELLCTAGFPAIYTQILTQRHLPQWEYYGYLGLYNLAYVLDDSLIVTIAVVTLGQRKLQEHEGRWLKLVSGTVMLGLSLILIARPEWLTR
jgi:glutaredoxin